MSEVTPLRQPRLSCKLFAFIDPWKLEEEVNAWLDSSYDDADEHGMLLTVVSSNVVICPSSNSSHATQFVGQIWYRFDYPPEVKAP
jgi:hypothetical protein